MNQITLTSLEIDGHYVEIPVGLSELLTTTWVAVPEESKYLKSYNRKVVKKDGQFVTLLTKRGIK